MSTLHAFASDRTLTASRFTAIGAFMSARLGYFDWEIRDYIDIPVDEQVEVLTLAGDIALEGAEPKVHAHVVLGRRDGSTCGGHLREARVRPTLEVMLVESPGYLKRGIDKLTGLPMIQIGEA
jgi:predicted DNA-binding protein with PD1-like motif